MGSSHLHSFWVSLSGKSEWWLLLPEGSGMEWAAQMKGMSKSVEGSRRAEDMPLRRCCCCQFQIHLTSALLALTSWTWDLSGPCACHFPWWLQSRETSFFTKTLLLYLTAVPCMWFRRQHSLSWKEIVSILGFTSFPFQFFFPVPYFLVQSSGLPLNFM